VRRLLALVCAIVLVDTMLYAALVPLLPRYADELDLSKTGAGLLAGAYAVGVLLGALPGGYAAARFGPRRAVIAGMALLAVASVGFAFASTSATLGAARVAQGLASALTWAGGMAWLMAAARGRRGELLGTALGAAIFGALLGPVVGALGDAVGVELAFSAVGVLSLALLIWAVATPGAPAEPPVPGALRLALRRPEFLAGLWLMVLPSLLFGVQAVLIPLKLDDAGWGAVAIGALFLFAAGLEAVLAPLVGRYSDRRGRLVPVRFGLVASTVVAVGLALATRPALVAPLVIAAALVYGMPYAPALALLSEGAERVGLAQGIAFGLMNGAWAAGNMVGPSAGGALGDAVGDALPYLVCAGLCVLTLAGLARRAPA
jgi:MFS family permease